MAKLSLPRRRRTVTFRSNPWARDCLRRRFSKPEKRIGQKDSFERSAIRQLQSGGERAYHLLCGDLEAAAWWYEDDRRPRNVRPGLCQFSVYGRTAAQPPLGQAGAHDEPARIGRVRRCAPRFNCRERMARPSDSAQRAPSSTDASCWKVAIALHTPRPMPLAIWCNSTMLCARRIRTDSSPGSACHEPPGARPSNGAHAAATPERIGLLGFRHHRHAHPVSVTDLEQRHAKHLGRVSLLPGQLIEAIRVRVSGRNRRTPSTAPPPTNSRAKAR